MSEYNNHLPVPYTTPPVPHSSHNSTVLCFALSPYHSSCSSHCSHTLWRSRAVCVCVRTLAEVYAQDKSETNAKVKALCCALLAGWPRPRSVGGASERALSCNIRASKMPASKRATRTQAQARQQRQHIVCVRV